MRSTFEASLRQTCPTASCYEELFEHRVTKVAEAKSSLSASMVELEYRPSEFIAVRRFGPGVLEEAIRKLGNLCGICSAVILAVVFLRRVCGGGVGGRLFSKRKATVDL